MAIEKNIEGLTYHRIWFAYIGREPVARFVVQSWATAEDRLTKEPEKSVTHEVVPKYLIDYNTDDYAMYNYDKTKENCENDFVAAFYGYMKAMEEYQGGIDV